MRQYVEQRNGGYYVQGTRVSLDSVVYAFLRGESCDGIVESFPALSLEQVYGSWMPPGNGSRLLIERPLSPDLS